jgi:hypothetical protein
MSSKGLNAQEVGFAVKRFKFHHQVRGMTEILEAIKLQEEHEKAHVTF